MERLCIFIHIYNKPYISLWPIRSQFDMDLARAPRRRRLTARKKGSGYENGESPGLGRSRDDKKWQYLTATRQGVAKYSLMKYTSLRNK